MLRRDVGFVVRWYGLAVPLLVGLACEHEATSPASRDVQVTGVRAARAPSGPSVSSANPPYGDQGTTLSVQVNGSGFTQGASATWLLNGVANGHVHTNSTTFNSSTQLTANITIDPDAEIALWDVQVALVGGKNGVGSDVFTVTTAQVLSTTAVTYVEGTNNLGDVVGYMTNQDQAFVYDDAAGFVELGPNQGWALDPDATVAFGSDGNSDAIEWTLQPDGTWAHQVLPAAPNSVGRHATSAARMADGTLLVAGVDATGSKNNENNRPVVWRRINGSWSAPTIYAFPAGVNRAFARTVNALGQVGGQVMGSPTGAIWDSPTTSVQVDGLPNAINSAGTIAVGQKTVGNATVPAYWWRDPVTQAWNTTGVLLPTIAGATCKSGIARGMNDAGVIVGQSCNGTKDQATVWHIDFSGSSPVVVGSPIALPGLGSSGSSPISSAAGISQTAPYLIGGSALSGGSQLVVRWTLSQ